jgi:hypothetical protein
VGQAGQHSERYSSPNNLMSRAVHSPCNIAMRPNPSLEPGTSTGMALGPRAVVVHHPSRGLSAIPAPAPQLKR